MGGEINPFAEASLMDAWLPIPNQRCTATTNFICWFHVKGSIEIANFPSNIANFSSFLANDTFVYGGLHEDDYDGKAVQILQTRTQANHTDVNYDYETDQFFPEATIAQFIYQYVTICLVVFGVLSNIFSIYALWGCLDICATTFYLVIVAVIDLIQLATLGMNDWLRTTTKRHILDTALVTSNACCKLVLHLFGFARHVDKWLVMTVAFECAMQYRNPTRNVFTMQRSHAVTRFLAVLMILVNGHFFWSYSLKLKQADATTGTNKINYRYCNHEHPGYTSKSFNEQQAQQNDDVFTRSVWPVLDTGVGVVIPVLVCVVCLLVASCARSQSDKRRVRRTADAQCNSTANPRANSLSGPEDFLYPLNVPSKLKPLPKAYRQMARLFYWTVIYHLVLSAPRYAFDAAAYFHTNRNSTVDAETRMELIAAVVTNIVYFQMATKALVYYAAMEQYRQRVWRLLTCRCVNDISCHALTPRRSNRFFLPKSATPTTIESPSTTVNTEELIQRIVLNRRATLQAAPAAEIYPYLKEVPVYDTPLRDVGKHTYGISWVETPSPRSLDEIEELEMNDFTTFKHRSRRRDNSLGHKSPTKSPPLRQFTYQASPKPPNSAASSCATSSQDKTDKTSSGSIGSGADGGTDARPQRTPQRRRRDFSQLNANKLSSPNIKSSHC